MDPALAQTFANRFGTPFYAYDLDQVRARVADLFACLPAGSRLYYSLKANPLPALVREARMAGCRAEVTSEGELTAALEAGCAATDILAGGPAKSPAFLHAALTAGVRQFSCESFSDLARLSTACETHDVEVEVLLRVNPADAPDARLAMSGVDSQFGFTEPLLLKAEARSKVFLPRLHPFGVHIYFGTQVAGVDAVVTNTRRALDCAQRVSIALGFDCNVVNAGGGFPWPFGSDSAPPDLVGLRAALETVWFESPLSQRAELWFESGRSVVAVSGTLVARVMEVKPLPTRTFVMLDTGIHHLGGMSGLGRVPRPALALRNLSAQTADHDTIVADVAGPLCTPLDCLARGLSVPAVKEGDLIGIPNLGAYGLTASLTSFLSHPAPVEVVHRAGADIEAFQLRTGHAPLSP